MGGGGIAVDRVTLGYARLLPRTRRVSYLRAAELFVALFLPVILLASWAFFGCVWLTNQSWWFSGNPWEQMFAPVFIDMPFIIGTVLLSVECVMVVVMVLIRKWSAVCLAVVPLAFVVWLFFTWFMLLWLGEGVFP